MDDGPLRAPLRPGPRGVPLSSSLCLRVVLLGSHTPVWRRVRVPARMTLRRVHAVLRCAFGRFDTDAHRFRIGDVLYGNTTEGLPTRDSRWTMVGEFARPEIASFRWELGGREAAVHDVRIEAIGDEAAAPDRAVCLGGEGLEPGARGGVTAAEDRVEFIAPDGPEHHAFDVDEINAALARLR